MTVLTQAPNANLVAVKDSIAAFNTGDLKAAIAPYADDAVTVDPTGTYKGKEQILASSKVWQTAFPDAKGEVTKQFGAGDDVATEVVYRGTHTGPLAGPTGPIQATGKRIEMSVAVLSTFRNGKIQNERSYFDLAGLMAQLGLGQGGR